MQCHTPSSIHILASTPFDMQTQAAAQREDAAAWHACVTAAQQPATGKSTTGRYVTHPHCIASAAGAAAAAAAGLVDPAGATTSAALQQVAAGRVCASCHLLQAAALIEANGPGGCGPPSDCSGASAGGVGDSHTSSGGGGGNSTHGPAYGGDRTDRVDWAGRVHRDATDWDYHRGGGHAGCGGHTEAVLQAPREVHGHTQLSGSQR